MQTATSSYGIHLLLSAIKYLDTTYSYGERGAHRVVADGDRWLHKAIGSMTDLLPERTFLELIDDRNDYWQSRA